MLRTFFFILFCSIVGYCIIRILNKTNKAELTDLKNSSAKYKCDDIVIDNHTQKLYKILGLLDNYEIEPVYILKRLNGALLSKPQSSVENEFLFSRYSAKFNQM